MENNLFFTCGFQGDSDWVVLSNREPINSAHKEKMITMINNIERKKGGAGLEFIPEPEVGLSELSVICDGEKYLFTLAEYDKDGNLLVRMKNGFTPFSSETGLVDFKGEPYPVGSVIDDFDFIKKVFVELLETGDVSRELMDL